MTVTLTLEQLFAIIAGLSTIGVVIWRIRPYVQGEVARAVEPLRAELHAWRAEEQQARGETQESLRKILDQMQPMRADIDCNTAGNAAGKAGLVRVADEVRRLERRAHNLEIHGGLASLSDAAMAARADT